MVTYLRAAARPAAALLAAISALSTALPTGARGDDLPYSALVGFWEGEASHRGQRTPFHLEVTTEGEKQVVRLGIPAAGVRGLTLPARISGSSVLVGQSGLPFAYDAAGGTLTTVLPKSMVPAYRVEAVFRRAAGPPPPPAEAPATDLPRPAAAWSVDVGGPVWAGIAYDEKSGLVLLGTDDGSAIALRARSGERAWTARTGGSIRARPTVADAHAFVLSDDGWLYKLTLRGGKRVWRSRVDRGDYQRLPGSDPKSRWDRYGSSALVSGGRVFVGSRDGALLCIDAASGKRRWSAPAGDMVTAAPALLGDAVFYASYDGKVRSVGAADGKLRWEWDAQGAVPNDLVVAEGRLLAGSRAYDLTALDPSDGHPLWQYYYWFSWVESPPAVRDGVAYVGSSDAVRLFAFDARDGSLRWERPVPGWAWSQPAVLGDAVFVGTVGADGTPAPRRGGLLAVDRKTGLPRWMHVPERKGSGEWGYASAPAIAAGLVVAADLSGRVSAFAPGTPPGPGAGR